MRERDKLVRSVEVVNGIQRDLDDALTLLELGEAEGDDASVAEAEAALTQLGHDVAKRQVDALLSGEADGFDTYVEIHAGAGGTESQDWALMLLRMYTRWAEKRGYKTELLEYSEPA